MNSEVEKSIIRGAKEALALAKGEADPKKYKVHIPDEINVKKNPQKAEHEPVRICGTFRF